MHVKWVLRDIIRITMYLFDRYGGMYAYLIGTGKLVGTAALYPRTIDGEPYIELSNFFVKEEYRCRGIGSMMIEELLKFVQDNGFRGLVGDIFYLDSMRNIIRRLKFYLKQNAHVKIIVKGWGQTFNGERVPILRFFIY